MRAREIERINAIELKSTKDAQRVLGIETSSIQDITRAFKKMAMAVHPDKNPKEIEKATIAFKKVTQAKEMLVTRQGFSANARADEFENNSYKDFFENWFGREAAYMKGPLVRKARDILLTWAGKYDRDVHVGFAAQIRKFFIELEPIDKIDKANLMDYVNLLFPDRFVSSDEIARQFKADDLENILFFLSNLMKRYDFLKKNYQQVFKDTVNSYLTAARDSLTDIIKNKGLEAKFSELPLVVFTSFIEFAHLFSGHEAEWKQLKMIQHDEVLDVALDNLNQYMKLNTSLFSDLFNAAKVLRQNTQGDFFYSETGLEKDAEKAKKIDQLCLGKNKLDILNAQFSFFMHLILGNRFNLCPESKVSFPPKNFFEFKDFIVENNTVIYLNVLTREELKYSPKSRFDTPFRDKNYIIAPVIPGLQPQEKGNTLIDFFVNDYLGGNAFTFISKVQGEYGEYADKGLNELGLDPILTALQNTWTGSCLTSHLIPATAPTTTASTAVTTSSTTVASTAVRIAPALASTAETTAPANTTTAQTPAPALVLASTEPANPFLQCLNGTLIFEGIRETGNHTRCLEISCSTRSKADFLIKAIEEENIKIYITGEYNHYFRIKIEPSEKAKEMMVILSRIKEDDANVSSIAQGRVYWKLVNYIDVTSARPDDDYKLSIRLPFFEPINFGDSAKVKKEASAALYAVLFECANVNTLDAHVHALTKGDLHEIYLEAQKIFPEIFRRAQTLEF